MRAIAQRSWCNPRSTRELKLLIGASLIITIGTIEPTQTAAQPNRMPAQLPTQMLGRPLPSPELPIGTVTVKVIGASISDRLVGVTVRLMSHAPSGIKEIAAVSTGPDGRARFDNLSRKRTYVAHISAGDSKKPIVSHVFQLPESGGVRLLLSTHATQEALAAADPTQGSPTQGGPKQGSPTQGKSYGDPPQRSATTKDTWRSGAALIHRDTVGRAGTVTVVVRSANGAAQPGVRVMRIDSAPKSDSANTQQKPTDNQIAGDTDSNGELRLAVGSRPFLLRIEFAGIVYTSEHLNIEAKEAMGAIRAEFVVFDRSQDISQLYFGRGSHLVFHVGQGRVGVLQVLVLVNRGKALFDAREKLAVQLPEGALNPQTGTDVSDFLAISSDKKSIQLTKPLPPGRLPLRFFYELPYTDGVLEFRQGLPLRIERSLFAIDSADVKVEGPAYDKPSDHALSRSNMHPHSLNKIGSGQPIEFTISGLPERDYRPRVAVLALGALILCWALFASIRTR